MNKSNSRDHYNYSEELLRRLVSFHDLTKPFQLEIQPGIHCDLYRCPHCYGLIQSQMRGVVKAETYIKVFDEIEGIVPLIQLSGIRTEPTTHPDIVEIVRGIKEREFICGLHTKGYRLNSELRDVLTDDKHDKETYVNISLDSSNSKDYATIHDIAENKKDKFGNIAENYFDIVINNIQQLYKLKKKRNSQLHINILYLLVEQNFSEEHLEEVINLVGEYCSVIRFSIPQSRNDGFRPDNYLDEKGLGIIKTINEKYSDNPKIRVLLNTASNTDHNTKFKYCYAQLFQTVIDKAGYVFPCPQVPLFDYKSLAYGNIQEKPLLEILDSAERKALLSQDVDAEMKCRVCDRKDESINIKLSEIFLDQDPSLILSHM